MGNHHYQLSVLTAAVLVGLAGCKDEGVRTYRAPKSSSPSMAAPAQAPSQQAEVTWTLPEGWKQVQNDQPMRVATFRAGAEPGVEVSVTAFPGDAGGPLANVNRWRGQLGLAPAVEADLAQTVETTNAGGVEVSTLTLIGSQGQEMLGAMIHPGDGKSWFVKATAEPKAAEAIKPSFVAFARSFKMGQTAAAAPHADMGSAHPDMGSPHGGAGSPGIEGRLATWAPPSNWKPEDNSSGIIAAAYKATNAAGEARATATSLLSDGGGPLANINRWRDQLKLGPVESLASQPTIDLGNGAVEVDLVDTAGTARMVAAIVPSGNATWFFKLTGAPKVVEAERAAFDRFVKGVGLGAP